MNHVLYQRKQDCCGCEACTNICPLSIISMEPDEEGFYYPRVLTPEKCINCGRCEAVCPVKHTSPVEDFWEDAYAGYALSDQELCSCASGGLASAMARQFIRENGIVYGVQYGQDCREIIFSRAVEEHELERYKTSKYVQARKFTIYKRVAEDIKAGNRVLFIGLPCECFALQRFLGKTADQLYLCALMCHGPTSQTVHTQYCDALRTEHPRRMEEFSVRYKKEGWKPYYIRAKFQDGWEYLEKFTESTYGIAFLYLKRPSCTACQIKRSAIHADITIGDYHLAANGGVLPYNKNGVSSCVVHTQKGRELISQLNKFHLEGVSLKNVLYSEAYCRAIPARKNRSEYGRVFAEQGLDAACQLKSIRQIEAALRMKRTILRYGIRLKRAFLKKIRRNRH